jgi:hypothetical protein
LHADRISTLYSPLISSGIGGSEGVEMANEYQRAVGVEITERYAKPKNRIDNGLFLAFYNMNRQRHVPVEEAERLAVEDVRRKGYPDFVPVRRGPIRVPVLTQSDREPYFPAPMDRERP